MAADQMTLIARQRIARDTADAAFIEEFESMTAQNPNFTFIPTLTRHRGPAWPYEKGYLDQQLLKRYLIWPKGPIYHIAGPPGMVSAMTELLNSLGVSNDDLKTEEFGDYKMYQNPERSKPGTTSNDSYSAA